MCASAAGEYYSPTGRLESTVKAHIELECAELGWKPDLAGQDMCRTIGRACDVPERLFATFPSGPERALICAASRALERAPRGR